MIKKVLFIISILFGLTACSERYPNSPYEDEFGFDENTSNKLRLFPNEVGSYWIYEIYDLDSMNVKMNASKRYDSTVVEAELVKAGKTAKLFSTYTKNNTSYQKSVENYYAVERKKLLTLQSYLSKFFQGVPIQLANFSNTEWITLIDSDDDLWRIYRMKLENVSIPNYPFITLNGKIEVLASWEGKKKMTFKGNTVDADEYLLTFEFDADITIPVFGKVNIGIDRELNQFYVNDIGLIYEKLSSSGLSIPLIGSINLNGYESKLISYHIK